jgi:hypothetical protein
MYILIRHFRCGSYTYSQISLNTLAVVVIHIAKQLDTLAVVVIHITRSYKIWLYVYNYHSESV